MAKEIRLTTDGAQKFSTVLNGVTYEFNVNYNTRYGVWFMDITLAGSVLSSGIALLSGIDIVRQFTYALKNLFVVNIDNPNLDANANNLGTESKLFQITDLEISEIEQTI